jgi:hypothetical protein
MAVARSCETISNAVHLSIDMQNIFSSAGIWPTPWMDRVGAKAMNKRRAKAMNKETPKDDPRQRTDKGSLKQTDTPWKGNPEKEQRSQAEKDDLETWHRSGTH